MDVALHHLEKSFAEHRALDDISLTIRHGELVALLGPSGCGKTTLLRVLAGLELPDAGQVTLQGVDATDLPTRERGIGFVFQHYALFQHMTVFENVAFGLRIQPRGKRASRRAIDTSVTELLKTVQLDAFHDRHPSQLSGGQRQRVALARALAIEPGLLLLDEPFGALDAQVRKDLRRWLRTLHDAFPVSSIFVTHDQEEAFEIADRIIVMHRGRIEQDATPDVLLDAPATPFVEEFLSDLRARNRVPKPAASLHMGLRSVA